MPPSIYSNSPKELLLQTNKEDIYRIRHSLPGAEIRQEINQNIENGSIPIFPYPLPCFDITSPPAEWSTISKSILSKTKKINKHALFLKEIV
jgi:hypothetical protein